MLKYPTIIGAICVFLFFKLGIADAIGLTTVSGARAFLIAIAVCAVAYCVYQSEQQ